METGKVNGDRIGHVHEDGKVQGPCGLFIKHVAGVGDGNTETCRTGTETVTATETCSELHTEETITRPAAGDVGRHRAEHTRAGHTQENELRPSGRGRARAGHGREEAAVLGEKRPGGGDE